MTKLTPAMERALDRLTGTPDGKIRSTDKTVKVNTARALHARGLAYLDTDFSDGRWELILIEPQVQEIGDEQLQEMTSEEQRILTPLTPAARYRVRRHAHIRMTQLSQSAPYSREALSYTAALHVRADLTYKWKSGAITEGAYRQDPDLAGVQWKAARSAVVNAWEITTGGGQRVMVVSATTREQARTLAEVLIQGDPVGYRELVPGYATRRLRLGELTDHLRNEGRTAL